MEQRPCLVQQAFHADVWGQDVLQGTVFCMAFSTQVSGAFLDSVVKLKSVLQSLHLQ